MATYTDTAAIYSASQIIIINITEHKSHFQTKQLFFFENVTVFMQHRNFLNNESLISTDPFQQVLYSEPLTRDHEVVSTGVRILLYLSVSHHINLQSFLLQSHIIG